MIKTSSSKIAVVAIALLVVALLWQLNSTNDELTSVPVISDVEASTTETGTRQNTVLSGSIEQTSVATLTNISALNARLLEQFDSANKLAQKGQTDSAIAEFKGLIDANPNAIEPYINLAALYAREKQLTLAQETLDKGIKANAHTEVLNNHVKDNQLALELPMINSLSAAGNTDSDKQAQGELKQLELSNREFQNREQELQKAIALAKKDNVDLQRQLKQAKQLAQKTQREQQARITALQTQLQANQVAVASAAPEQTQNKSQDNKEIVINLVKSWAKNWSNQDVEGYINHYVGNYARQGLSHNQWRVQRRERLTNKAFINVDVSQFIVERKGAQFVVTFSQHYKSDTVDDRIRKQLVFASNNNDWQRAKIVSENVVSQ